MAGSETTFGEFSETARQGNVVPVSRVLFLDTETPVSIYLKLRGASAHSFLFESVEGGRSLGRYSIVGLDPVALVSARGDAFSVEVLREEGKIAGSLVRDGDEPLQTLRALAGAFQTGNGADRPRFTGGWVGYFGYESVRFVESIPVAELQDGDLPDVLLGLFTDVVVIDNVARTVTLISNVIIGDTPPDASGLRKAYDRALQRIGRMESLLRAGLDDPMAADAEASVSDKGSDRKSFTSWVEKGKEYIKAGDIFQVVLSRREIFRFTAGPLHVYRALRRINPSPYMYFLSLDGCTVIGSSPEMLVRVEGRTVQTRPIAGTRKRGSTEAEDHAIETELRADTKEKAEHLMLVDLARNDLGRICDPGSVSVPDFMSVEKYSHVMHICSTVSGSLAGDRSAVDALYACFPAGTLTGAPKIRAMQIIREVEGERRGVYGGAVGYIDFSGNLDTCIAIRTIVERNGEYRLQAGAGIVFDSVPEREYQETVDKMQALREAVIAASSGGTA